MKGYVCGVEERKQSNKEPISLQMVIFARQFLRYIGLRNAN
jgi:hypothetical protein